MAIELSIIFDQNIVNWINKEWPDRNWVVGQMVNVKIGEGMFFQDDITNTISSNHYEIRLEEEIALFFKPTTKQYFDFITKVCNWIVDNFDKKDIYLSNIYGILEYSGDTSIYASWRLTAGFDEDL